MTQCKWTACEVRLTLSAVKNATWQCVISHTNCSDSDSTVLLKKNNTLIANIHTTGTVFYLSIHTKVITRTISHYGKRHSSHQYSNLPSVTVHALYFNILQLILGFHSSYLKKVFAFFSQARHI